jgi:glycosyltransferase involved in cell wall biosynthesis
MEEDRLCDGPCLDAGGRAARLRVLKGGSGGSLVYSEAASSAEQTLNPRNICVVTETYPPEINGVALTVAHLVSGLRARGHTVTIVHPQQRTRQRSDGFRNNSHAGALGVRGLPFPGYPSLQFGVPASRLLLRTWRAIRPAVVYVATEGPLGWSAVHTARRLGIPTVSGFHTNFHHYCKHYGMGWLQHLALRYLRWFHNQTERTVVSSEDLRNRLRDSGFRNVSVLERGVDSQLFAPQRRCSRLRREWNASEKDLVLLSVGRIAAEKNLGLAIEAYRTMKQSCETIKFVIVGEGPLRLALEKEHKDVVFAGLQTFSELARYYASADIFLFPSETETFGNVTLEAMASGLAVIAYNYAAAKLHITHKQTGVLVRLGDANAFIDSACDLIREPQAINRIRRQARQYATQLNWPRVVEKFEGLLLGAGAQRVAPAFSPLPRSDWAT